MTDLLELAKRVEDIKRGSGHLDYLIWQALGLRGDIDYYTTSLDAAMTLVPDGWLIETITQISFDGLEGVSLVNTCPLGRVQSFGTSTLHLALCAAALRAHAAMEKSK